MPAQATLIPAGSAWKYLDTGVDLSATGWRTNGFNDTLWVSGLAPLGYGDPHIVTTVGFGLDANMKYITTYFRRSFVVTNAALFGPLNLRVLRDDGVVVYLNGTEVFRDNLPAGAVTAATLAPVAVGAPDETAYFSGAVPGGALTHGTNR